MSRARPLPYGAASPAGSRISCCESAATGPEWPHPLAQPGTLLVLQGTAGHPGVVWDSLRSSFSPVPSHPLCLQSTSRIQSLPFISEATSQVPSARQPPPWPPAAIHLLQSVLFQAARGIFLKLQITSGHSPNLPGACGSST